MAPAPTAAPGPVTVPRFTVDMLDEMPDTGHRYELLDGFLLVTPPPRPVHEVIVMRLGHALREALVATGAGYVVTAGGVHPSDTTYLQPDVLVVPSDISIDLDAQWSQVKTWWLAIEVISPGSRVYDTKFKLEAYLKLGVESVWLVDPEAREIQVYDRRNPTPLVLRDGDEVRWRPAALAGVLRGPVVIDVTDLFQRIGGRISREEG
jgi:Uma2 family endonuclease